jgi:hypothetical protein
VDRTEETKKTVPTASKIRAVPAATMVLIIAWLVAEESFSVTETVDPYLIEKNHFG